LKLRFANPISAIAALVVFAGVAGISIGGILVNATRPNPHVLVVLEENHEYSSIIGSSSAPYINSLANQYGLATNWYATRHPSLPNYLALTSGSTQGVTDDCTSCGPFSGTSLGGELSTAGIPWKAYMETMPSNCYTGGTSGSYAKKHNPFVYYSDVLGSTCASHVVPFTNFNGDMTGTSPPDFAWVTPNLDNDMHDGSIATGDTWLKTNIAPVLASPWFANNGIFILTWDEGSSSTGFNGSSGGHIVTVVVSSLSSQHLTVGGNHYGTLRAIEGAYGLSTLGAASNSANGDLSPLFPSFVSPTPTPTPTATVSPTATPTSTQTPTATPSPSPTSGPNTVTILDSADAYIYSGSGSTNNGSANPILFSAATYRSVLRFPLSNIPSGATIDSVTLNLFSTVQPSSGGIQVRFEPTTWVESTITWNNQPAWSTSVIATSGTPVATAWTAVNLPVGSIAPGSSEADFGLSFSVSGWIQRVASDEDSSHDPQLVVSYH